jgi:hypothetical protein
MIFQILDASHAVQDETKLVDDTEIATTNEVTEEINEIQESSDEEEEDVVSSTVAETTKVVEKLPTPVSDAATITHLIVESDDDEVELVKPNQSVKNDKSDDNRKRLLSPETGCANMSAITSPDNKKLKLAATPNDTGIINIETDDESDKDSDILVDELVASFVDELNEDVV